MKKIFLGLLIVSLSLAGCSNPFFNQEDDGRIKVVSSIYPMADIVSNLGGPWVKSDVLVAPGQSPHTYDPQPSDVAKLSQADLVLVVGVGLDDWVVKMAESSGIDKNKIVDLSQYVTLREFNAGGESGQDPHYWVSPRRAMEFVDDITSRMKEIDSGHATDYDSYLEGYNIELTAIDAEIVERVNTFTSKDVVVFHDAFGYFAADYGLNVAGVFEITPGTEPTPQELEGIVKTVKDLGVRAVFKEPQLSSQIVEAVQNDLGLGLGVLDPLGGIEGRLTYISLVKSNLLELARLLS
ncbi:MAG: metal ABC transporter substrate-binding protein [Patescibacteria group bacterium]